MIPVVTAQEMSRIEQWAVEHGASQEAFMLEAGNKIARVVRGRDSVRRTLLLVGKGNNGGDAYAAGIELLKSGYEVRAFALYSSASCSPLNRRLGERFALAGGQVDAALDCTDIDLILDGFLGTGFEGELEEKMALAIAEANASLKPIFAIDIPSGLNGTTGEGKGAILATETLALGLPKIGFFLRDGWNCLGKLRIEEFGLSLDAVAQAKPVAWIPNLEELQLPPMARSRHKYQRGFVVGFGGSKALKGAVKLSGLAALHTGAGIVKIFSLEEIGATADELICQLWNLTSWKEALAKAQAVFVGPGLGRSPEVKQWLREHLQEIQRICVLDADALYFLPEIETWPAHSILTPHRGEMAHLLGQAVFQEVQCQEFVDKRRAILVLKGAPTWIFAPHKLPVIIPHGDPGMATAGSGDVLTGMIAALVAQGKEPYDAAILGTTLHALAGEAAAQIKTSYGYSATDLIAFLPEAMHRFLPPNNIV